MAESAKNLKSTAQISLLALAGLLVLSIIYFRERLFFADTAFIVFNIMEHKMLYIQEHRYGSFVTQLGPYIEVLCKAPVRVVLLTYAVGFNLFYLLTGLYAYWRRKYAFLLVLAFYYLLLVSDTFFWPNNEIHQAVAWMVLFFVVNFRMAERKVPRWLAVPVFVLLAFFTIYTHFIVLLPLFFLWVFLWLQGDYWPWERRYSWLLTGVLVAVVLSKFLVTREHSYDEDHLHNITHMSLRDIYKAFTTPVVINYLMRTLTNYWLGAIVCVWGIWELVRRKKTALAAWCVVSIVGYFLLMGIAYSDYPADVLLFHVESEWQSMGIIMAVPFIFYVLPRLKERYGVVLVSLIFIVRFGYIIGGAGPFVRRYEGMEQVMGAMRQKHITKLMLRGKDADTKQYMFEWGVPDESILMSAMHRDNPQLTYGFLAEKDTVLEKQLGEPGRVYASFELTTANGWNYDYFRPDTLHAYRVMTKEELLKK